MRFSSLNRVIDDSEADYRDHLYFAFMSWQRAVRDDRYKLIEYCVKGQRHTQLFDLKNDPDELQNLADDARYADVLARLRNTLRQDRKKLNDGNTPYPFSDKQGKAFWKTFEADASSPAAQ